MRSGLLILGLVALTSPSLGAETLRYFKEIAVTMSQPYHFEGLWPSLNPQNEDHYEFILNETFHPVRVTHYDSKGKITDTKEGWASFKLSYDVQNRVIESTCYKADGRLTICKSLKFAKEVIIYDPQGNPHKTLYSPAGRVLRIHSKGLFP